MALARDQGGITARRRVEKALQIFDSNERLEVMDSDLSQPGAGLCQSDVARLRRTVQTVIHCAGDTSFFPQSLSASRALSIDGPIALLAALGGGRLERWCQISTAFVCGRRCGTVFESEGAVGQDFHNPYEEIKLESEMALRDACSRLEVDLRILRPSVVIGPESSTQGGSPSSLLYEFIRLAAAISGLGKNGKFAVRIQGRPSAHFNIVPIEYVSAAIEASSKQPGAAGGTFHLVVSQPPTQEAMLQMITSRLGVNGLRLIDESCEPMRDGSSLEIDWRACSRPIGNISSKMSVSMIVARAPCSARRGYVVHGSMKKRSMISSLWLCLKPASAFRVNRAAKRQAAPSRKASL